MIETEVEITLYKCLFRETIRDLGKSDISKFTPSCGKLSILTSRLITAV